MKYIVLIFTNYKEESLKQCLVNQHKILGNILKQINKKMASEYLKKKKWYSEITLVVKE